MADWFSSLATQALQYADSVVDSIATQANEAKAQVVAEQKKMEEENERLGLGTAAKKTDTEGSNLLPWETNEEDKTILTQELMEKILNLSLAEGNFTMSCPNKEDIKARGEWDFLKFIPKAMKLMEIDSNLKRMHAKVCPKMNDEELFWFNYFCRVHYLRANSGIDGSLAKQTALKWKESEIISAVTSEEQQKPKVPFLFGTALKESSGSSTNDDQITISSPHDNIEENLPVEDTDFHIGMSGNDSPVATTPNSDSNINTSDAACDLEQSHIINNNTSIATNDSHVVKEEKMPGDDNIDVCDDIDIDVDDLDEDLDDLDLDNLDDLDLGDVDDDDYENINGEEDFELEAAIARELAADN